MKTILFTTDITGLDLIEPFAVILPHNRMNTSKVNSLMIESYNRHIPCLTQPSHKDWETMGMLCLPYGYMELVTRAVPDIGVSWFYTMILPQIALDAFQRFPSQKGIVNFHAGDPGPHALRRAIKRGDKTIKAFWHRMTSKVDIGEVLLEGSVQCDEFIKTRQRLITVGKQMFKELKL